MLKPSESLIFKTKIVISHYFISSNYSNFFPIEELFKYF